ncbi:MAG: hypothetical protein ACXVFK_02430 [Solirubrobacteraceae bacterium]
MPRADHDLETPEPEEPEDVLAGQEAHDRDHDPVDGDDREVVLDEPDDLAPPLDDEEESA